MNTNRNTTHRLGAALALGGMLAVAAHARADDTLFQQTNLVSDGFVAAAHSDPNVVNPWGIAFNPFGPVSVANNGSGLSTLYDGDGNIVPLVVQIPSPTGPSGGTPTGIVFNGSTAATSFVVSDTTAGTSGPSKFLFATQDGTIVGWAPSVNTTQAYVAVDNSAAGAVYTGIALGAGGTGQLLYAANFSNARVDVFDSTFAPVTLAADAFTDAKLPADYAPFGIQAIGGNVFVTYAKKESGGDEEEAGQGLGAVDVYDPNGTLLARVATHGTLNAPWGVALAPAGFGRYGNALLVGNFGDGTISAFDGRNYTPMGQLRGTDHKTIKLDGLWGIAFGNGFANQPVNTLFFAAGPDDEQHGLYGRLDVAP